MDSNDPPSTLVSICLSIHSLFAISFFLCNFRFTLMVSLVSHAIRIFDISDISDLKDGDTEFLCLSTLDNIKLCNG